MAAETVAELGHNDRLKIYVDPSKIYFDPDIQVHSNDLFSKSTAPMVLKFHMQHDKVVGLQNDEVQPLVLNIAKPLISTFFSRTTWYIWLKFCIEHKWDLHF